MVFLMFLRLGFEIVLFFLIIKFCDIVLYFNKKILIIINLFSNYVKIIYFIISWLK